MKEEELRRCQIQEWYPIFKPYSISTLFHPLPADFIRYILGEPSSYADAADDSPPPPFLLPLTSGREPLPRTTSNLDPISTLDSSPSDYDEESESDHGAPSFPALESAIEQSIAALGGAVFPKLNWSAPKDAAWISADGTLRCTSFAEIALLLHSSDRAVHDLCHAIPSCSNSSTLTPFSFFLALRKFYQALRPEMEFRCFVRRSRLVAISQRETTAFYPSLLDQQPDLLRIIKDFFDDVVEPRFELEDYTFDVYIKRDWKVKLIDFNPWGEFTLPLLFSWEELEKVDLVEDEVEVEFRLVENQCGVRPGLKSAVPYDYLNTAEGSGWDQFFKKADDELRRQIKNTEIKK